MKRLCVLAFLVAVSALGYAAQEESGICLPEPHNAEQQGAQFCHCLDMGGYRNCREGKFSRDEWLKNGMVSPHCKMDCKEDNCKCCMWQDEYDKRHKHARLTIPYDKY